MSTDRAAWLLEQIEHHADPTPAPCSTLRLLALPYSDRPGYREEWRP